MGSSHNPGQGERLLSIGRRSISVLLDGRRQSEADVREAVYIRPLGNGRHEVKNFCNEQAYKVGSALGGLTFTPGQTVQLASHTGFPGEVIIGLPPLGRRGASLAPIIRHGRTRGEVIVPVDLCPAVVTGKSYVGIYHDTATSTIYAWNYADGVYQSTISVLDWVAAGLTFADTMSGSFGVASYSPLKLIFYGERSSRPCVVTWNVAANTINVSELQLRSPFADMYGFAIAGSTVYGMEFGQYFTPREGRVYPFTSAVGAEGTDGSAVTYPLGFASYWNAAAVDGVYVSGVQAVGGTVYYIGGPVSSADDQLYDYPAGEATGDAIGGVNAGGTQTENASLVGGGGVRLIQPGAAGHITPCYIASAGAALVEVWPQAWTVVTNLETPIIPTPDGGEFVVMVNTTHYARTPSRVAIDGSCPRPDVLVTDGSIAQTPDFMIPLD